jgi:hypothetical protein
MMNSFVGEHGRFEMTDLICSKRPDELGAFRDYQEFRKSELAHIAVRIFDVPPTEPGSALAPWAPTVVKPDLGSGGWHRLLPREAAITGLTEDWVTQPWIQGQQFRVTVDETGFFAVSVLRRRVGRASIWRPAPARPRDRAVRAAESLRRRLGLARAGLDVIAAEGRLWLLDLNPEPDLTMHGS